MHEGGILLVGEVTEISLSSERRRRIYLAAGAYLMAEIAGGDAKITGQGRSCCIVLGNRLTQRLAGEMIRDAKGRISKDLIQSIFAKVGSRTASVSRTHAVLSADVLLSDPVSALQAAFHDDCRKSGWRLCDRQ